MAEMVQVICPENEVEYFCKDDWTGQISLIRYAKLDFRRRAMGSLRRPAVGSRRTMSAMLADAELVLGQQDFGL
jgi:hypothetical protein